jgi:hypothetical protein
MNLSPFNKLAVIANVSVLIFCSFIRLLSKSAQIDSSLTSLGVPIFHSQYSLAMMATSVTLITL